MKEIAICLDGKPCILGLEHCEYLQCEFYRAWIDMERKLRYDFDRLDLKM